MRRVRIDCAKAIPLLGMWFVAISFWVSGPRLPAERFPGRSRPGSESADILASGRSRNSVGPGQASGRPGQGRTARRWSSTAPCRSPGGRPSRSPPRSPIVSPISLATKLKIQRVETIGGGPTARVEVGRTRDGRLARPKQHRQADDIAGQGPRPHSRDRRWDRSARGDPLSPLGLPRVGARPSSPRGRGKRSNTSGSHRAERQA